MTGTIRYAADAAGTSLTCLLYTVLYILPSSTHCNLRTSHVHQQHSLLQLATAFLHPVSIQQSDAFRRCIRIDSLLVKAVHTLPEVLSQVLRPFCSLIL